MRPRVVSVVGARPQFVKLAPVANAMIERGVDHVIIHSGQHYDALMSDVFFRDLGIPAPDMSLGVGPGTQAEQTGRILTAVEKALVEVQPAAVLVFGDTNTTLAAALAAVKLHVRLGHLEAGLRSFNRRMPEEHNRVLTDHAADLLLAPTATAMANLAVEGLADRSVLVGDVMVDACWAVRDRVQDQPLPPGFGGLTEGGYVLSTLHRAENTDDPERLGQLLEQLRTVRQPVVLAAHPRLRNRAAEFGLDLNGPLLRTIDPLPYPQMIRAVLGARAVVTDSGGLQKEAFLLGTPCITLRTETEWPETLREGWNTIDPNGARVASLVDRPVPPVLHDHPYGDGTAARSTVSAILERLVEQ